MPVFFITIVSLWIAGIIIAPLGAVMGLFV